MKRILVFLFPILMIFLFSCSNSIKLNIDAENVEVVYFTGVLNDNSFQKLDLSKNDANSVILTLNSYDISVSNVKDFDYVYKFSIVMKNNELEIMLSNSFLKCNDVIYKFVNPINVKNDFKYLEDASKKQEIKLTFSDIDKILYSGYVGNSNPLDKIELDMGKSQKVIDVLNSYELMYERRNSYKGFSLSFIISQKNTETIVIGIDHNMVLINDMIYNTISSKDNIDDFLFLFD